MRVFVTGATGFVGLNIVQALLAAGHEPVCYVRPHARRTYLDRMPVRVVAGWLADADALARAMHGAEAVIHTAGNTSCHWRDIAALRAANVDSTRAVLAAARVCGVRRLVYTSTTSTIGSLGDRALPADESAPLTGFRAGSPYAVTKLQAEALLRQAGGGPECVVLNPAEVIGPWDHTLQWGRIVLAVAGGQLPFIPPGAGTFSPARDVAAAHVAALTRGRHGERYILGGHNVTFAAFIALVSAVTGKPALPRHRARWVLQYWSAWLQERLAPFLSPPALDAYRMRVFGGHHVFDDGKARRELGYATRPLRTAIEECCDWYRNNGFLESRPDEGGAPSPPIPLPEGEGRFVT